MPPNMALIPPLKLPVRMHGSTLHTIVRCVDGELWLVDGMLAQQVCTNKSTVLVTIEEGYQRGTSHALVPNNRPASSTFAESVSSQYSTHELMRYKR